MPAFRAMVRNAAGAVGRIAKQGIKKPSDLNLRWLTCMRCPLYNHNKGRCPLCGCRMRWKQALASENCPIKKW